MTIGLFCSTDLIGEAGRYSISKQIEKGTDFANIRGFSIKIFNETNNSGYMKLHEAISQKAVDGVWVESIKILSDSVEDLLFFLTNVHKNNCKLYIGKKRYKPGNLDFYQLTCKVLPIASEELQIFMPPQHLGRTESINNGKRISQNVFGYNYENQHTSQIISINSKEADIVKSIFDFYVNKNLTLSRIEKELTGRESKMAKKYINGRLIEGKFTRFQVMMILKRPEYIGKTYNRDHSHLLKAPFPQIIDIRIWNKAQELLKLRSISNRPANILSEIAHCSLCRSPYYHRKSGYLFHRVDKRSSKKCQLASSIKATIITDLIKVAILMKAFDKNLLEHQVTYLKMLNLHLSKVIKNDIEVESSFIKKKRTVSVLEMKAKDSDIYKRNVDSLQILIQELRKSELLLRIDATLKTAFYESLINPFIESIVNCDDNHLFMLIKENIRSISISSLEISISFFNRKTVCLPLHDTKSNKFVLAYYVIKNKSGFLSYQFS